MNGVFRPTEILLPRGTDLSRWSVVACDQHTSDRGFWDALDRETGDAPSTLRLILPEAYLCDADKPARMEAIAAASEKYLRGDLLAAHGGAYVLTTRTFADGRTRAGLVGVIDLEAYDYTGAQAPVRASEQTVPERLPPRVAVRERLGIDVSHVLALVDDAERTVIEPLTASDLPLLYDFPLSCGGGRITGRLVAGEIAKRAEAAIDALPGATKIVIGDGNHSLAAAKTVWEQLKPGLPEARRASHPKRFALAELVNVYDDGVTFHAIHRAVFDADINVLAAELRSALSGSGGYGLVLVARGGEVKVGTPDMPAGTLVGAVQELLDARGLCVDYIHGEGRLRELVKTQDATGIILPPMRKSDLFATVRERGVFPRKAFSIGRASEKRYYLECRRLDA